MVMPSPREVENIPTLGQLQRESLYQSRLCCCCWGGGRYVIRIILRVGCLDLSAPLLGISIRP